VIVEKYAIFILGVAMVVVGLTGVVRRESGALNVSERDTRLGRILTIALGVIWLLVGALFLFSFAASDADRANIVGYSSLIAAGAFLVIFTGALLVGGVAQLLLGRSMPAAELEHTPALIASASSFEPRYPRLKIVYHPDYGRGRVLSSHRENGTELVVVRFIDQIYRVPADDLTPAREDYT
jgi:hypothetical protein